MNPLLLSMARETVLWPVAATLAAIAVAVLLGRRKIPFPLAIACGFLTGYSLVYGSYSFPPVEAQGWIPYFILAALAAFVPDDFGKYANATRVVLQALLATAGATLLLHPLLKNSLPLLLASIVLWLFMWFCIEMGRGAALLFASIGNAVVCATTGSTMLGQLGGVLAAAVFLRIAVGKLSHAESAVAAMILPSLMLVGHAYAGTMNLATLLIVSAFAAEPLAKWLKKPILAWPIAFFPVAIAASIALRDYLSQESSGY
ncbi:MAG: hypothetical protein HKL98_09660 [Burkholderiales bacterium]|nr:hypothetical protein [Burkholderiales bacterium]